MTDQAGPLTTAATEAPTDPYSTIAGEGDTLETCAARLGVEPDFLFAINRGIIGSDPADIRFGMRLEVPGLPPIADPAQEG